MKRDLLIYLRIIPATCPELAADDLDISQEDAKSALDQLVADGKVVLSLGWYRLAEATENRVGTFDR